MNAESQLPELVPAGALGKNTAEELFFIARRDSNTLKFALFSGVQSAVFSTCTRLCAVTPVTFRNVFAPGRKTPYPGASPRTPVSPPPTGTSPRPVSGESPLLDIRFTRPGSCSRGLSHLPSPTHRGVPETRPCRSRCQGCIPSQDRRLSRGVGAARPLPVQHGWTLGGAHFSTIVHAAAVRF